MLNDMPVLYSFRRCPYAMRARMAIIYSGMRVELREVVLKNKPQEMLAASPKGTVPILVLGGKGIGGKVTGEKATGGKVIDESLDIMLWALSQHDPDGINITGIADYLDNEWISENDNVFKLHLDHYKYADRFPEYSELHYRTEGEVFLKKLDYQLSCTLYLAGDKISVIDIAIFPFVRQFAFVDKAWFDQCCYLHLRKWLDELLVSEKFVSTMPKFPQWYNGDKATLFPSYGLES